MNYELKNKVAIITGASSGYGVGIARKFKKAGAKLWIVARRKELLQDVAQDLGVNYFVGDIRNPEDWDQLFEEVIRAEGRVDILVNNAGSAIKIEELTGQEDKAIRESLEVNLLGAIFGSKRAAGLMVKQKSGTIVNVSSICSIQAWPGWSVYAAAKAGLEQFSKSLYVELRNKGVRVNCITPSWGNTSFTEASKLPEFDSDIQNRVIQPEEMGEIVLNICCLPDHLVVPEMVVLPMVQEIVPY